MPAGRPTAKGHPHVAYGLKAKRTASPAKYQHAWPKDDTSSCPQRGKATPPGPEAGNRERGPLHPSGQLPETCAGRDRACFKPAVKLEKRVQRGLCPHHPSPATQSPGEYKLRSQIIKSKAQRELYRAMPVPRGNFKKKHANLGRSRIHPTDPHFKQQEFPATRQWQCHKTSQFKTQRKGKATTRTTGEGREGGRGGKGGGRQRGEAVSHAGRAVVAEAGCGSGRESRQAAPSGGPGGSVRAGSASRGHAPERPCWPMGGGSP